MTKMVAVAGYIWGEMIKNAGSTVVASISTLLTSGGLTYPLNFYDACQLWKAQVGNRKPWDHKRHIKSTYGDWSTDATSGKSYGFDIWSNVHYGYVGRAAGFWTYVLKAGAGHAQLQAGTSPPGYWSRRFKRIGDADFLAAFDDPKDQAAIELGARLWDTYGKTLTVQQLIDAVRADAAALNTK
ncbi:hypothetical protein F1188_15230 [Roseospira marina]|uniref:Bacterial toxin 44 domain-containing protein n=1 Tax=Roseospira marina TaxID=140057 RepID=A0A5M6IA02_9PROT|nr:polymorphic toxin type 44 domain-containing protein [Roseospira marina]KAA5604565.1 hypothetical protein F1188_15230 [Roseospira marina]MBB4315312.1 hypothetical protein [Roseospira marina]MBB5088311.1 hypothetical protein [Roseospira marina]